MASYHCSIKTVGRSDGRSAVGAAAYRSGQRLIDAETGEIYDYTRKSGVLSSAIFLPDGVDPKYLDRNTLWDAATAKETRKNSTLARELEVALPAELNVIQRTNLLQKICLEIVAKHQCAVDANQHAPHRQKVEADGGTFDKPKNFHGHLEMSTRRLTANGFGEKTREWDDKKSGTVEYWRERIATLTNEALADAGHESRVDHRSLAEQGIDRVPTAKLPREIYNRVKAGKESYVADEILVRVEGRHAARVIKHETAEIAVIDGDITRWTAELKALTVEQSKQAQRQADEAIAAAENVVRTLAVETAETVVVVKKKNLRSEQELETLKKQRILESQRLHATSVELNKQRLQAKTADQIAIAKSDLIDFSNRLSDNSNAVFELDSKLLQLNSRFGGLADMLPDFMVPGRADLVKNLAAKRELATKIKSLIKKAESIAKADDVKIIDQKLFEVKRRQAQIISEVADMDADLAIVNRQPKARQPQHSRLVRHRDKENEYTL
ncbi:MAG: MobA/MobL family protein [Rhodoferax sp.]|nr:MobA/MobL family protein [Rhodoferax sp.]MBP9865645.1 MobA/MobL family protein [Candidatus Omnitrophota bacterium]